MPKFETRRRVPYTPGEMYALVADVESYPEFLPLCEGLDVLAREPHGAGELLRAEMRVGYQMIRERFTTQVTLDPTAPEVLAEHLEGPFTHLTNRWRFYPAGQGCEVDFHIDYAFKSLMLQMLVGGMFEQAFRKFADAFEQRARETYGPR